MYNLFFELLQVSLGSRICLSHSPSTDEWNELYKIAKKQSLVGVCFVGVQRLQSQMQTPSDMLFLTWMGLAAKIQQRNEIVNGHCIELQEMLIADGIKCSILKGQAIASLYKIQTINGETQDISLLRQSGDIDILVDCNRKQIASFAREKGLTIARWDYKHFDVNIFKDTEVEVHYRPGVSLNLWRNKKLQKFWKGNKEDFYNNKVVLSSGCITTPSSRMHTFYILHHTFRHLISGGVGLRQMMDLYFALLYRNRDDDKWLQNAVKEFGMLNFAEASTWILETVFCINPEDLPWSSNENEGRFVLNEIMIGGNFGHGDDRYSKSKSHVGILHNIIQRNFHFARYYGSEALAAPVYYIWHFCWKRMNKID